MKLRKVLTVINIILVFWLLHAQIGHGSDPLTSLVQDRVTNDGAWSWFTDPRAIYYKGKRSRTYIGWIDSTGSIKVASYDYRSHVTVQAVLKNKLQRNDHANPALLMRPGGRLMVFWSAHLGKIMYYKLSALKESIGLWGPTRKVGVNSAGTMGYTYQNPVQLRNEKYKIYLFWRGANWKPTFSTSTDGIRWSKARTLITVTSPRPYVKVASNSINTIHFAFTEDNPSHSSTSIYYMYYRGGNFYKTGGRRIGSYKQVPFRFSQLEKIYNGS